MRTGVPPAAALRTLSRVEAIFGPGGAPRAGPPRLRAARRAGGARGRRRVGARERGAPPRRGGDRHRQEPRLPDPGARVGPARGRLDRDEGAPGAAADEGRPDRRGRARPRVRVAVLKGRQNYLCRHGAARASSCSAGSSSRARRTRAAFDAMRGWIDTTETGDRAELDVEPPDASGRRSPSAPTAASVGAAPSPGAASPRLRANVPSQAELVIANHALYFADLGAARPDRRAGGAARARRGRLRRGAPARGVGGDVARRPDQRPRHPPSAPRRRPGLPRGGGPGAGARARPGRSAAGRRLLARGRAAESGRRRLREVPAEPAEALAVRLGELAEALTGRKRRARRGRRPGAAPGRRRRRLPRGRRRQPRRLGRARPARLGAGRRRRRAAPSSSGSDGPTAILVSATLTAGGEFGFVRDRLGLPEARRARGRLAVRLPRAGAALPAARLARPAVAGAHSTASAEEVGRALPHLRRAARSS